MKGQFYVLGRYVIHKTCHFYFSNDFGNCETILIILFLCCCTIMLPKLDAPLIICEQTDLYAMHWSHVDRHSDCDTRCKQASVVKLVRNNPVFVFWTRLLQHRIINSFARCRRRTSVTTVLPSFGIIIRHVASSTVNLRIQLDWHCLRPTLSVHHQSPYRTCSGDWRKRSGRQGYRTIK